MTLSAYHRARAIAETPRGSECRLMSQITGELVSARDADLSGTALMPALHRNRELWAVFTACCAAPGNALPDALRGQIVSIGLWVDRFTSEVMAGRGSVDRLIEVNRAVITGLM